MPGASYRTILVGLAAVVAVALVVTAVALLVRVNDPAPIEVLAPTPEGAGEDAASAAETTLRVYISGAVQAPGVYSLPPGDRLVDLLTAAGGETEDADLEKVNLAQPVQDGQHYHIPRGGEEPPVAVVAGTGPPRLNSAGASPTSSNRIDLNSATATTLETLPGIGPARARAIVDYRESKGPFSSVEEVMNVSGIGRGIYESIRDLVTVDNSP